MSYRHESSEEREVKLESMTGCWHERLSAESRDSGRKIPTVALSNRGEYREQWH